MQKVSIGPVLLPGHLEPSPGLMPIWPSPALLADWPCPLCGMALANGTPIGLCEKGLAHAHCGGEG